MASGAVVQADDTVITVAVFDEIVRICPRPVPALMRICEFVHWFVAQALALFVNVDAAPAVAVPVANELKPLSSHAGVETSLPSVPSVAARPVMVSEVQVFVAKSHLRNDPAANVPALTTYQTGVLSLY